MYMLEAVEAIKGWFRARYPDLQVPDGDYTIPLSGRDYVVTIAKGIIQDVKAR